jgi:hypothetical protein
MEQPSKQLDKARALPATYAQAIKKYQRLIEGNSI